MGRNNGDLWRLRHGALRKSAIWAGSMDHSGRARKSWKNEFDRGRVFRPK